MGIRVQLQQLPAYKQVMQYLLQMYDDEINDLIFKNTMVSNSPCYPDEDDDGNVKMSPPSKSFTHEFLKQDPNETKPNIKIAPFAKQAGAWYIDITINGKTTRSPHVYIKDVIWEKIYEYYRYYYEKYFRDSK